MELYLVRHGQAQSSSDDLDPALSEAGAEEVRRMTSWAARAGVKVDQIRHSGKRRAEQTAALLAERLSPAQGVIAVEGLRPDDDVRPVADALRSETGNLMLVGHLPFMGRLVTLLANEQPASRLIRFRNAEMVRLSRRDQGWTFDWAMAPDLLDRRDPS